MIHTKLNTLLCPIRDGICSLQDGLLDEIVFLLGEFSQHITYCISSCRDLTDSDPETSDPGYIGPFATELRDLLLHSKSDFGDATRSGHGYDIRLSLPSPLPGRGAYVVLLGGRDRRGDRPVRRSAKRFGWRGLVFLVKLVVGLLFVLQILIAAVALMVWLL